MKVICEKYKECIITHGVNFVCFHSIPHDRFADGECKKNGPCGECNTYALRKEKLKKINESNLY